MRLGSWSSGGLGFGLVFSLVDDFTTTARAIEKEMQRLGGAAQAMATSVETAMARAKLGAGMLLVSLIGLAGWAKAAQVDAQFQNFELAFRSFLGTAEEAHRVFEQIKADAIANPKFSIAGMEKANLLLISQGVAANASMQAIRDLTTVLLGVGRGEPELQRVALAFEKIQAGGFLTGPQFRSLTSAGLPVVRMLKDIGIALDPSAIAKSKITFDQLMQALHRSVQAGGQFGNVWSMMENNISAKAAQIKEQGMAMLGDIGKAIRPVTIALLNFVYKLITGIQAIVATPFGQWALRVAFALNLIVFAMGAYLLVSSLAQVMTLRLAGAFGASTKAAILSAFATNGYSGALAVMSKALLSTFASMLPFIAGLALAYAGYKLIQNADTAPMLALGVALMAFLGPISLLVIPVVLLMRAWRDFNAVLNGSMKPAQGILGMFQRIGGIIQFTAAAFRGFNQATGEVEVPKSLLMAMDALGIGNLARNIATWVGRIRIFMSSLVGGFREAIKAAADWGLAIINSFAGADAQLDTWDALLGKNMSSIEKWKEAGRIAGMVIGAVLVTIIVSLGLIAVALAANAIMGVISWLAWLAPILLVIAVVGILVYAVYDIYNALFGVKETANTTFSAISGAGTSAANHLGGLAPQFLETGKALGSQLTNGITQALMDWRERMTSFDFSFWGGADSKSFHWAPGMPDRTGFRDSPNEQMRKERVEHTKEAMFNGSYTMGNPFSANAALLPMLAAMQKNMAGQPNTPVDAGKLPPITTNLFLDGKKIAEAVNDINKEEAKTSYDKAVDAQEYGN